MQNTRGAIPHRLNEGIMLEGRDRLIPWGTRIADMSHFDSVTVLERERSVHIEWRDQRCFGGLRCNVRATRLFGPPNPRAYHIYLEEFHWATLEILDVHNQAEIGLEFRQIFHHLENELGAPTWSYPRYESGLPAIHWEYPGLLIGYLVLGGCQVTVRHEPEGFEELKKEAQLIRAREGDGRRVNYVAW